MSAAPSALDWYDGGDRWSGLDCGTVTVARVQHAEPGEVEGGLGVLVRFMAGALRPDVPHPLLSPAGWYWQATIEARGVWTRPQGPHVTPEAAIEACNKAWANRARED